jgi:Flp pilus assembly protein TadG
MQSARDWSRVRRGAAAAELLILLSFFMLMILGGIDFGRFAYTYIAVIHAAEAGASKGSLNPYDTNTYGAWQSDVTKAVTDDISNLPGYKSGNLTVTATGITEASGLKRAQVVVTYQFNTITDWPGIPTSTTISRQAVMRLTR